MKTKYDVTVTQRDCTDGVRKNERLCVVATAIARLQPEASRIEVNRQTIRFSLREFSATGGTKTYRLVYPTPPAVAEYVKSFDDGVEPKPIKFTIDSPQVVEKTPTPWGKAKTPSFKPKNDDPGKRRRSVRVFGEKAFA